MKTATSENNEPQLKITLEEQITYQTWSIGVMECERQLLRHESGEETLTPNGIESVYMQLSSLKNAMAMLTQRAQIKAQYEAEKVLEPQLETVVD